MHLFNCMCLWSHARAAFSAQRTEAEEDLLKRASGRGFFLTINSKTLIPVHPYNIGKSHYGNCVISERLVGATPGK